MFLNTKLQSREKPIKVAFIGCEKFVNIFKPIFIYRSNAKFLLV